MIDGFDKSTTSSLHVISRHSDGRDGAPHSSKCVRLELVDLTIAAKLMLLVCMLLLIASTAYGESLSQKVEQKYGADTIRAYKSLYHPGTLPRAKSQDNPEDSEPSAEMLRTQTREKAGALHPKSEEMMNDAVSVREKALQSWGKANKNQPVLDIFKKVEKPK